MDRSHRVDPGTIAVVGATATEGTPGHEVVRGVAGFEGPVYPVDPTADGAGALDAQVVRSDP